MKRILIVYASTEGQTRKIASFIAATLNARGQDVDLLEADAAEGALLTPMYAAAILAGSLHAGHYQSALRDFARANADWLNTIPCAFVSVSLTATLDADRETHRELERIAGEFCTDTGLAPGITYHVPGALRYTQYSGVKRVVMRLIAQRQGGATDTTRDHEYTDWPALVGFCDRFLAATNLAHPTRLAA